MLIIVKLTTDCNLSCSYCSEGNSKPARLPEAIFYKLIGDIPEFCHSAGTNTVEFLFHGGEPMLYGRSALKDLMDYARKHLGEFEIKFLMQTNGTLIDAEWIDFFQQEEVSLGVSFDGYPEIHDKYRLTKKGEPTANTILENIHAMRERGLSVGTLMVLNSSEAVDVEKLFDFICKEKLHPKIHPVVPCGRASERDDVHEVCKNYVALMEKLCELALSQGMQDEIQPADELLDAILNLAPIKECSFNGSCGKNFISLFPDGEMGFCGRDNAARRMVYGNIMDNSLLELYNSGNAQKIRARQMYLKENDCKNCSEWELCHGGCAFEAMNSSGKLEAKFAHCEERRELLKWMRTKGLALLRNVLVQEKTKRRSELRAKKQLMREIDNYSLSDIRSINNDDSH